MMILLKILLYIGAVLAIGFGGIMLLGVIAYRKEKSSSGPWVIDMISRLAKLAEIINPIISTWSENTIDDEQRGLLMKLTAAMEKIPVKLNTYSESAVTLGHCYEATMIKKEILKDYEELEKVVSTIKEIYPVYAFPWENSRFFMGCRSFDEVVKRFREQASIYSPDNKITGNADVFRELKEEYDRYTA